MCCTIIQICHLQRHVAQECVKFEAVIKTADGSVDATLKHRSMSKRRGSYCLACQNIKRRPGPIDLCVWKTSLASCVYAIVIAKHFTLNFPSTLSHLYVPNQSFFFCLFSFYLHDASNFDGFTPHVHVPSSQALFAHSL